MSEVYRKNHDPGVQECHNALDTAIMTSGKFSELSLRLYIIWSSLTKMNG